MMVTSEINLFLCMIIGIQLSSFTLVISHNPVTQSDWNQTFVLWKNLSDNSKLKEYLPRSHEKYILKNDSKYDEARSLLNQKLDLYPAAIKFVAGTNDIRNAIRYAKENAFKIAVRSGRHSYEGFSSGNGVLVIDVSKMKLIRFFNFPNGPKRYWTEGDTSFPRVKLGTGLQTLEINQLLMRSNLTIPLGTCPTIGLAGLALGGGIGLYLRELGLTIDSIIEYEIIDYNGKVMHANDKGPHKDLFWALNGAGGGNFGVVTSVTFKSYPTDNTAIFDCHAQFGKEVEFIEKWFIMQSQSNNVTSGLNINKGNNSIVIDGWGYVFGHKDQLYNLFAPLLPLCQNATSIFSEKSYSEIIASYGNGSVPSTFSASSIFFTRPLDSEAVSIIRQRVQDPGIQDVYVLIRSFGPVNRQKSLKARSSFPYRDALAISQIHVSWKPLMRHNHSSSSYDDDPLTADKRNVWIKSIRDALKPYGKGAYINYPDSTLENPLKEYWGENLLSLKRIHSKYDPYNLFCFNQSVKPC